VHELPDRTRRLTGGCAASDLWLFTCPFPSSDEFFVQEALEWFSREYITLLDTAGADPETTHLRHTRDRLGHGRDTIHEFALYRREFNCAETQSFQKFLLDSLNIPGQSQISGTVLFQQNIDARTDRLSADDYSAPI
jgi:hypothetical protein